MNKVVLNFEWKKKKKKVFNTSKYKIPPYFSIGRNNDFIYAAIT